MSNRTYRRTLSKLPSPARDVAYLMRRAGFGGTLDTLDAAASRGLAVIRDQLVNYEQVPDNFTPPPADAITDQKTRDVTQLTVWWLNRMITTSRPLQEKMTLFWHGHFATANSKVRSPNYMYRQNQLFRTMGMGRFDDLLGAVYKDPAMLIWLDGQRNVKGAPNENFAREVMELFTIGRGNYTEDDVHAGAKAFTGWRVDDTGQVKLFPRLHDDSQKTYLGQTGNWNADDIVRILSAHPATGTFLATRMWRFFASDQPPASAIATMAAAYYNSDHSIRAMVAALFNSPEFYREAVRDAHVKSPVEFVVSTIVQFGLQNPNLDRVPRALAILGQELFNPPNVGGWAGGANWINAGTMLSRFNWASVLTGDAPGSKSQIDPNVILNASGAQTVEDLVYYVANLLGISLTSATEAALYRYVESDSFGGSLQHRDGAGLIDEMDAATKIRGLLHLALISPEYQIA